MASLRKPRRPLLGMPINTPMSSIVQALGQQQAAQQAQPTPVAAQNQATARPADPRFRSFVERYVIERAAFFRVDPEGHMEDQWQCIQDAKRVYALIKRVGEGAANEEAEGF